MKRTPVKFLYYTFNVFALMALFFRCGMSVDGERTQVYKLDKYYGKVGLACVQRYK